MPQAKIHFVAEPKGEREKSFTACGMVGWAERGYKDEYSTANGDRFEATPIENAVTCKRCLRSTNA